MSLPNLPGFTILNTIGFGSCGTVYLALREADQQHVAIKFLSPSSAQRDYLSRVWKTLSNQVCHLRVLPIDSFSDESNLCYVVMPLLGALNTNTENSFDWKTPTLYDYDGPPSSAQTWDFIFELAQAIAALHRLGITHGNLLPQNILLTESSPQGIRITDVGQGVIHSSVVIEYKDHALYLAPEQFDNAVSSNADPKLYWDVYSFGVLSFLLLNQVVPRGLNAWVSEVNRVNTSYANGKPTTVNHHFLLESVKSQPLIDWQSPPLDKWEERCRNVIERSIDLDPSYRWTDLREILAEFDKIKADQKLEQVRITAELIRLEQHKRIQKLQWIGISFISFLTLTSFALGVYGIVLNNESKLKSKQIQQQLQALQASEVKNQNVTSTLRQEAQESTAAFQKTLELNEELLIQRINEPATSGIQQQTNIDFFKEYLLLLQSKMNTTNDQELIRYLTNASQITYKLRDLTLTTEYSKQAQLLLSKQIQQINNDPNQINTLHKLLNSRAKQNQLLATISKSRGKNQDALQLTKQAAEDLLLTLSNSNTSLSSRYLTAQLWIDYSSQLLNLDLPQEATAALAQIPAILQSIEPNAKNDEEVLLFSHAEIQKARIIHYEGRHEEALLSIATAITKITPIVESTSPHNQKEALLLASTYIDAGEISLLLSDIITAYQAFKDSLQLLLELQRLDPSNSQYSILISRCYNAIAILDHQNGDTKTAISKILNAIAILNPLLQSDPDNENLQFLLAKLKSDHAKCLIDSQNPKQALEEMEAALTSLKLLFNEQRLAEFSQFYQKENLRQIAKSLYTHGSILHQLNQIQPAISSLQEAEEYWKRTLAKTPSDELSQLGLKDTQALLEKLKKIK
jgi:serine/threonine protein kinase